MSKHRASKRKKGRVPPHLRKYLFKKKRGKGRKRSHSKKRRGRKVHHMAKRRKSHKRRVHHRRRRRGGGGGRGGWIPPREDLHLFAAAGAVGWLETQAAADANHVLNKIPRPIEQIGYTGGTAIAAWAIAKFTGNRWARLIARAAATAAAFQMGKHGGMFAGAAKPSTMSGDDYLGSGEEHLIDDMMMGELESEGSMSGDGDNFMEGVPFDGAVHEAGAHA